MDEESSISKTPEISTHERSNAKTPHVSDGVFETHQSPIDDGKIRPVDNAFIPQNGRTCDLGVIQNQPVLVHVALTESAEDFKLAADQGLADAQSNYGCFLVTGNSISVDLNRGAHYLKLAADQGYATGQYNYGICLLDGIGVSRDLPRAAHYFKLAADQGIATAQLYYGLCLRNGNGVSIDLKEGRYYSNLLQIKELLKLSSMMDCVCEMVMVFQLI
jgi:hypothetical protein